MDVLESVIFGLTSDEVRRFKILSNRFKADEEKKLLILFDAIRSEKYTEEDHQLLELLYGENSPKTRNRYYRLRNKLLDNIEKSLVFYHFKYQDAIHAYYDIQLSLIFSERGLTRLALYFLKKAEKKAVDKQQAMVLEQIYHCYTLLATTDLEIDIEPILERRAENLEKVNIERANSQVLALITQRIRQTNFSRSRKGVNDILETTRNETKAKAPIYHSRDGKIRIFRTVSGLLLEKEAYSELVDYLNETIAVFEEQDLFDKETHSVLLMMRLWLALSYYKIYAFKSALSEMIRFSKEMEMYDRQNYETYLYNYYNVRINILKCTGRAAEAETLIGEALKEPKILAEGRHHISILRSLADHQFNHQQYKDACETLAKIRKHKSYKRIPDTDRMFLEIFEMVNHFEAGDYAFIPKRFKAIRKNFKRVLKSGSHERTRRFMELLNRMNDAQVEGRRVSINAAYKNFKAYFHDSEHGDREIFLYDLYLLSKRDERPYYHIFLEHMAAKAQ